MKTNKPLEMIVLTALPVKVLKLGVQRSGMNGMLLLWKVEKVRGVFLGVYVYKITHQNTSFSI
jgi:hypothetical protein